MAQANAEQGFRARRDAEAQGRTQVDELRRRLRQPFAPSHIECVDIATFQGGETVGALVAFRDGRPWKDGYRRFRIRSVVGTDDFASVAEVLQRRFREGGGHAEAPDLLVIDGGLGQLAAARAVLAEQGRGDLPVVALAKERVERDPTATAMRRRPERVFLPGRKNPLVLRANSSALFLLQRLRDEAHRFANEYHRRLRAQRGLRSPLDDVAGIGASKRRRLLRVFGSTEGVRRASLEELVAVPGITAALAARIKEQLARETD
jgi:excinuclease ABC subunit C